MASLKRITQPDTQTDARLKTLEKKAQKLKGEILERLSKTPIVMAAINACGVGRSTYYKWRKEDAEFARLADVAIKEGRKFVNDIAVSKLMQLIDNGNLTAIIFWLKNNSSWFSERVFHEHEHEHHIKDPEVLPPEEVAELRRAMRLTMMAGVFKREKKMQEEFLASDDPEGPVNIPESEKEEGGLADPHSKIRKKPSVSIADVLKKRREQHK